ncbi:MAG: hypothetical protein A3G76_04215 [Acidobacteria bacterium RIFCSPLOWO2_12_FULL_65_11]|nr:MAG: hypothetical protein A3H95_12410 [Acidobacteria bacterium RIFCSPLOWO2_02_FULL_64_15]OFW28463.1 MAG: hypothetical protein A3G76_04215 [Acidobacteria bacterium RIFCSPLOWO2_12_FULL_65_11]
MEPPIRRVLDRRGLGDRDDAGGDDSWAAEQRERLEGVCRYALRPPVARERRRVTGDGRVRLQLRHRWVDGTTHLEWDPLDFLGRLAVLVPRPRINLVLYHGVLAPRAAWRSAVVRYTTSEEARDAGVTPPARTRLGQRETPAETPDRAWGHTRNRLWADLMRRTFRFDVLACPRCGGRLRLVARGYRWANGRDGSVDGERILSPQSVKAMGRDQQDAHGSPQRAVLTEERSRSTRGSSRPQRRTGPRALG